MRLSSLLTLGSLLFFASPLACSTAADDDTQSTGDEASAEDELRSLVLTEADNGKTVNVPEGQNVVVKLSSNPSTGYSWVVASTDRTFGYPYYRRFLPDGSAVGSGGKERMTWRTKGPLSMIGTHHVKLEYKREWETTTAATRTFEFTVEIREVVCPQISIAHPDFCKDGTIVAQRNADGCVLPPKCEPKPPPPPPGECVVGGCSSEICADEPRFSACVFMPEYACYKTAECKRQADGLCGWTMSPTLLSCLSSQGGE